MYCLEAKLPNPHPLWLVIYQQLLLTFCNFMYSEILQMSATFFNGDQYVMSIESVYRLSKERINKLVLNFLVQQVMTYGLRSSAIITLKFIFCHMTNKNYKFSFKNIKNLRTRNWIACISFLYAGDPSPHNKRSRRIINDKFIIFSR